MDQSLKKITIKGLAWSAIEAFWSQGIRFIIGIVIARLLAPEMFGLISMLLIFITFGEIFVDSGFGTALVQKQKMTEQDICSVFYFNIFIGFIAAALLFFTAPMIAVFYKQPLLTSMARALSVIFIINSLGMIQANLLIKKVDFKSLAKLNTIANLLSGMAGIALAMMGFGVWSLVIQQISASIIRNFFFWFYSAWRPSLLFSISVLSKMLKFCLSILAIGILNRSSESIYYVVIGKLFSASDLGVFSRASQIQGFPSSTLTMFVGRVAFSVFAKLQHEQLLFKSALRSILTMISFLIFPMMIGLGVVARPLILFLLTEKWAATIPYLQLLVAVGIAYPLEWIRQQAMQALGKPDLSLRVEIYKKILLFVSLAVMWYLGIEGIILGMILASVVSLSLNIKYVAMLTKYSVKEQLFDMLPYLSISLLMGLIIYAASYLLNSYSPLWQLVIEFFVGFVFYVGTIWLFKATAITEIRKNWNLLIGRTN